MNSNLYSSVLNIPFNKVKLHFILLATLIAFLFPFYGIKFIIIISISLIFLSIVPNLHKSFLLVVVFIPSIFEIEKNIFLSTFWIYPTFSLAISYLYTSFTNPKRIYFNLPLTILFLIYIFVCGFSLAIGFDHQLLGYGERWGMTGLFTRIRDMFLYHIVFLFAMSAVIKEHHLKNVFWVVIISGVFYAISIFITGSEPELGGRQIGIFADAHPAAIHMLICSIFSISLIKDANSIQRIFLVACFILFNCTHFYTFSKTLIISFPFVILFWAILDGGLKRFLQLLALISFITLILIIIKPDLSVNVYNFLLSVFFHDSSIEPGDSLATYYARLHDKNIGLNLFLKNIFFGVGFSNQFWVTPPFPSLIHNYYLVILIETGIIGFILFISIVIFTFYNLIRARNHYSAIKNKIMISMLNGILVSIFSILMFFNTQPGVHEGLRHLWILIGIAAAVDEIYLKKSLNV